MTTKEFEEYLVSIGGLKSGYYTDRPPIVTNFCECSDGWLQIIHDLIEELIALGWNREIRQVKEKFGGLRFYAGGITEEMQNVVGKYCKLSYTTCEVCGSSEGVNGIEDRWVRTLCSTHQGSGFEIFE